MSTHGTPVGEMLGWKTGAGAHSLCGEGMMGSGIVASHSRRLLNGWVGAAAMPQGASHLSASTWGPTQRLGLPPQPPVAHLRAAAAAARKGDECEVPVAWDYCVDYRVGKGGRKRRRGGWNDGTEGRTR
eukprot:gene12911-biopygen13354